MSDKLELRAEQVINSVEEFNFEPIKGYPLLNWKGKRPFTSTQFYPAQLKENHGEEVNGWMNQIFWGDNLQVMSHLLKKYRGQVDLVYIDPPFDSKADYKKKISLKGQSITNDNTSFEEKQYTDIWTNDEYLQFLYERLILIRELLSATGNLYLQCDWHKNHLIRCIMDEVFGSNNFRNEIIWKRRLRPMNQTKQFGTLTETILWYTKSDDYTFNSLYTKENTEDYIEERFRFKDPDGRIFSLTPLTSPNPRPNMKYVFNGYSPPDYGWSVSFEVMERLFQQNRLWLPDDKSKRIMRKQYLDEWKGYLVQNLWTDIAPINPMATERLDYPTQKPENLLERIILASSNPDDLIFDCFMGSGTTQAVAMKLGRRFLGADINLGALQLTTKRLLNISKVLQQPQISLSFSEEEGESESIKKINHLYTGFSVFNVNYYDVFRNPVEAKDLLIKALEIQPLLGSSIYDGEKDGRMVKIMPVNRIATRSDLNELITNFDYKTFEKRNSNNPSKPVESIMLVCMGHEPDLGASLQSQMPYKLDIEVIDILRDKSNLEFKRDSEAEISIEGGKLIIREFYPMNLLQKLSIMKENIENWKELTESVMIDFNYDGSVFEPSVVDVPEANQLVKGVYQIPKTSGTIRVKITDLLSESFEKTIE